MSHNKATEQPSGQFSEQAASISVRRDQYENEIPVDQTMHENPTPGQGEWHWEGNQYANDFGGGQRGYGVEVKEEDDRGRHPVVERITVDAGRNKRGEES